MSSHSMGAIFVNYSSISITHSYCKGGFICNWGSSHLFDNRYSKLHILRDVMIINALKSFQMLIDLHFRSHAKLLH